MLDEHERKLVCLFHTSSIHWPDPSSEFLLPLLSVRTAPIEISFAVSIDIFRLDSIHRSCDVSSLRRALAIGADARASHRFFLRRTRLPFDLHPCLARQMDHEDDRGSGFDASARGIFGGRRRRACPSDPRNASAARQSHAAMSERNVMEMMAAQAKFEAERRPAPSKTFVDASTGLRLRVCEWKSKGCEAEANAVFLHASCDEGSVWNDVCLRLCAKEEVQACYGPDMRGHGGSARSSSGRCDARALAEDLRSLVVEKDLYRKPLLLVGEGEGACVAVRVAALCPQLVGSVVCINYAADVSLQEKHVMQGMHWSSRKHVTLDVWSHDPELKPEPVLQLVDLRVVEDVERGGCKTRMDPNWCFESKREERIHDFAAISCPLLLIRGEASKVCTDEDLKSTQQVAAKAPLCKIRVIKEHGDHLSVSCPRKLSRILARWLQDTEDFYHVSDPESRRPELLNIRPLPEYGSVEEAMEALRPRAVPTAQMIADELAKLRADDEQSSDAESDVGYITGLAKEPADYYGFLG